MSKVKLYSGNYKYTPEGISLKYTPELVKIYDSSVHVSPHPKKTFVFDLDETIGSFGDMYSLWNKIESEHHTYTTFQSLLEMFPEFLRPGIVDILSYINVQFSAGKCFPVYLYTNNQCDYPTWVQYTIQYLDWKLGNTCSLFAKPVCAFKIRGKRIELSRTEHAKSYGDFIRCSMLPKTVEVCYVDDVAYAKMKHDKVYFIQPPPYQHGLSRDVIIDRFILSDLYKALYPNRTRFVNQSNALYIAPAIELDISKRIMYFVREFFFVSLKCGPTKKRRCRIGRFSRRTSFPRIPI